MSGAQKIKMLLAHEKISMSELARRLGTSPQAFNQKLKRDTFTLQELERIADTLKIDFEGHFVFADGQRV